MFITKEGKFTLRDSNMPGMPVPRWFSLCSQQISTHLGVSLKFEDGSSE